MIKAIIDKYAGPSASLQDLRLACLCSTAFTGFFRYNEICNIQPAHLEFSSEYLKIFVPRAKNDVYREGNYVYIKRLGSKYCAVSLLQRYISMAKMDSSDNDLPLFRRLRYYKSTNSHKLCRESYLIPDVEKSCKTASRRLDTTTKITVCTVYVPAERPQQCKIITTCQKGHLNGTDGGNQIQQKICTFWKKFHNALRLLTI